ncbi:MAG: VOC family protein [Bdellovibrionota bacterium]
MKFGVSEFATIRLCVADVKQSKNWYAEFFGTQPVEDLENFVSFKIAGTCLDLAVADEKSPLSKGGSVGYWLVDDFEAAITYAIELGGKVYRGPLKVPEVRRIIAQIEDPYGNVVGIEGKLD